MNSPVESRSAVEGERSDTNFNDTKISKTAKAAVVTNSGILIILSWDPIVGCTCELASPSNQSSSCDVFSSPLTNSGSSYISVFQLLTKWRRAVMVWCFFSVRHLRPRTKSAISFVFAFEKTS